MSDTRLGELERLTRGERLLLSRRRAGETQLEAATRHGTTYFIYGKWERDVEDGPTVHISIPTVKAHERCLLYRRRTKITQREVARVLGRCRRWVNLMERGEVPCDELVCYWEQ